MPIRTFTCKQCNVKFQDGRRKNRQFCGIKCRQQYLNHPSRNPAKRPEVKAKISKSSKGHKRCVGRFMSLETRQKISKSNMGKKRTPEAIKKAIATYKRNRKLRGGPTLAEQRHYEQLHPSGPDHWNWKGGTSKQRDKEFNSPEYKAFRQAVLKRDKYTCQHCGARNGLGETIRLKVHHIKSYAEFPELRFEINNGLTLCKDCHDETKRGKPRNKRRDFIPTPRPCECCGKEYSIRNPRKYCPDCQTKICCPICGSTVCHHSARRNLPHYQSRAVTPKPPSTSSAFPT